MTERQYAVAIDGPSGAGKSTLARAAAAVGIDALFTEVHPRPDEAFSDGPNSLDFNQVREILTVVKQLHDAIR